MVAFWRWALHLKCGHGAGFAIERELADSRWDVPGIYLIGEMGALEGLYIHTRRNVSRIAVTVSEHKLYLSSSWFSRIVDCVKNENCVYVKND